MTNFFNMLFGKNKSQSANAEIQPVVTEPQPTMAESQSVEDKEELTHTPSVTPGVVTVNLQTGRPIDAIYLYIKQDNESLGYNDAIHLHNMKAMEEGVARIKNKLRTLLDQVNMKYKNKILKQQSTVKMYHDMCYSDSERDAQYLLDQLNFHIQEVERLRKDLESNADNVRHMIETYEKGFKQGMLDINGGGLHSVAPISSPSSDKILIEG